MDEPFPRIVASFLLLAALAFGCGGMPPPVPAAGPASTPKLVATAKAPQAPPRPPAQSPLTPVDCEELLGDAAALIAVEGHATEEQMARVLNIANAVEACPQDRWPKIDDLRLVLVQARNVLADWYSELPEERAASLGGDTSTLDASNKPVMDGRRWAEAYLRIEERLASVLASLPVIRDPEPADMRDRQPQGSCSRVAPTSALDGRRLDSQLGWCALPHVLLRVDAMAGALSSLLSQSPSPDQEDIITARLDAFRDALLAEAAFWIGSPTLDKQRVAVFYGTPNKNVFLSNRITRISLIFKALALSWGTRPLGALRNNLGNAFRSYVSLLEAHGIEIAKISWATRIDDGVNPATGVPQRTRTLTLRRIHEELLFDQANLQALFEIRDAEDLWATLLDRGNDAVPDGGKVDAKEKIDIVQGRMQAVNGAAQLLLRGFRHTETRQARLAAASRLVMTVDMDDGLQIVLTPGATRGAPTIPSLSAHDVALRKYSSRVLAELALCLLNDALLDVPSGHGCDYPIMPPPAASRGAACRARPLAAPFLLGQGAPPPIPERVRDAYERVIATLENTWLATGMPAGEAPITDSSSASTATVCELSFFTSADTMARLGMGLRSYRRMVSLIADRRLPIEPSLSGPVIAAGMKLAERRMTALCDTYNPEQCSAKGIEKLGGEAAPPGRPPAKPAPAKPVITSFAASVLEEYCTIADMGEGIYGQVSARSAGNGLPLLAIVEPYLANLAWGEVLALGNGFIRAGKDCTAWRALGGPAKHP